MMRILYHFTTPENRDKILAAGAIEPLWPAEGLITKVVHTTDSTELGSLPEFHQDGRTIRFEVRVPGADAHHWHTWGSANVPPNAHQSLGIPVWTPENDKFLTEPNRDSNRWYVIERPIGTDEWVEVVDTESGTVLWPPPGS